MPPIISARNLTKCFGELTAVDGIDFDVEKGECFGFLGPNGAGKTSTMRMIYCASPLCAGDLSVCGISVEEDVREVKRHLGVVTQDDSLDPDLTVEENLMIFSSYFSIPRCEAKKRANELIDFLQLGEKRNQKIENLSGGLKRRLLIARSLINRPEILILDEPTTGLDPQARHLIWRNLQLLKESGVTMILTTHYMEEAERLCDRLVIMNGGKILTHGKPKDLILEHAGEVVLIVRANNKSRDSLRSLVSGYDAFAEDFHDSLYIFFRSKEEARDAAGKLEGFYFDVRQPTLEDIFLKLAGRDLHD